MARFIMILNRICILYLYFVLIACFLGLVPNINPNYPLFNFIFKAAGFYLIPPIFGISFSPAVVLILTALIAQGLSKIYDKYFNTEKQEVIIMSPEEFFESYKKANKDTIYKEKNEEKNDDK